jgi:hypothetical protein
VPKDQVTQLFVVEQEMTDPAAMQKRGTDLYKERGIASPENCGACHY